MTYVLLYSTRCCGSPYTVQAYDEENYGERTEEGQECIVIVYTDAIVYPWTVMIESLNAFVANCTVPRSGRAKDFTVWTHLTRMNMLKKIDELVLFFQYSRVFE